MLPPIPPSRRARLDVRLFDLDLEGVKSITPPSSLPTNLPGPSHPTPGPPGLQVSGLPGSPGGFRTSTIPASSTPSSGSSSGTGSGSGSGSGSGTGSSSGTGTETTIIPNTTASPPPASSSSSSSPSGSTPLIFVNGSSVPLLAIVLPIVFVFLALLLGSLFFLYRKARKSNTPPRHSRILLRALLIASFLWIPILLVKLALRAHRRRARRGTLIVAGDPHAAYSKLGDDLPPMARTPSPADADFLGLYGRYAPQPPPVGVVVLRPGHGMMVPGRFETFAAPPPYEGPPRRGGGEDEITAVGATVGVRPATAPAGRGR